MEKSIYNIEVTNIDGNSEKLEKFKGKALLVVNVASECGFTKQYKGLQELYSKYKDQGLEILGFPCNQFGGQEPGSDKEIQKFCTTKFDVTFPLFSKIEVNGDNTHPLYKYLKKEKSGILGSEGIKWNFTKFLVDKEGKVVRRFAPNVDPVKLEKDVEAVLP